MGLFDLFRPKWKHSDPQIRIEAVRQMTDEQAVLLAEIARADPDAAVRRMALKRIDDPQLLGELSSSDPDEGLRRAASEKAAELLLGAAVGEDETRAMLALERIGEARAVAEVARRAAREGVRRAAVAQLTDAKALAEVARRAEDAQIRRRAVEKLRDATTLREVALNDGVKEVALQAVARLEDPTALETVAHKAKIKAVRQAARARIDAAAGEAPAEEQKEAVSDEARRRARQIQLCRMAENAANARDLDRSGDVIAEARAAWLELGELPADDEYQKRFDKAVARFEARVEERRRVEEARAQAAAVAAAAPAAPVETPAATETNAAAAAAEKEARAQKRQRAAERDQQKAEERARKEAEQAANLARLEELCVQLEGLAATEDRKLAEQTLKTAQAALQSAGRLPEGRGPEVRERLAAARGKLVIRLNELRETEDWKRWANVPRLEALCARVEGLLAAADAKEAARELKAAQADWKSIGPAPKEKHEALWARFKKAADEVHARTKERFAELDEARTANLAKKEELCARVEALAESSDWKETSETIKLLQEEWKAIGPTPKEQSDAVWKRFRGACDKFFERRKEHFGKLDEERAENLKKQEALCTRVEALADSSDWKPAADKIKAAQAEWKTVGPAPREQADAVWQRFRGACDKFFERRKAAFAAEDAERAENLAKKEALVARVEAMIAEGSDEEPGDAIKKLMAEWKTIGPAPRDVADEVWDRFRGACDRLRDGTREPEPAPAAPPGKFEFGLLAERLATVKTEPSAPAPPAPAPSAPAPSAPAPSAPAPSAPAPPAAAPPPAAPPTPAPAAPPAVDAGWLALADEPKSGEPKK
jgi:hypothetical protein